MHGCMDSAPHYGEKRTDISNSGTAFECSYANIPCRLTQGCLCRSTWYPGSRACGPLQLSIYGCDLTQRTTEQLVRPGRVRIRCQRKSPVAFATQREMAFESRDNAIFDMLCQTKSHAKLPCSTTSRCSMDAAFRWTTWPGRFTEVPSVQVVVLCPIGENLCLGISRNSISTRLRGDCHQWVIMQSGRTQLPIFPFSESFHWEELAQHYAAITATTSIVHRCYIPLFDTMRRLQAPTSQYSAIPAEDAHVDSCQR